MVSFWTTSRMNLSEKQIRTFGRIHNKYNVSLEFLTANFHKVVQLYKYVTTNHLVIKQKLKIKNNRVFIKYNHLRTKLFKTKKHCKVVKLSWSKQVALRRKRLRCLQKAQEIEESDDDEDLDDDLDKNLKEPTTVPGGAPSLSTEDVQKKIKEQLEILKSGKRNVSLLGDVNAKSKPTSSSASAETSRCNSPKTIIRSLKAKLNSKRLSNDSSSSGFVSGSGLTILSKEDIPAKTSEVRDRPFFEKGKSFLDSLIRKLGNADGTSSKPKRIPSTLEVSTKPTNTPILDKSSNSILLPSTPNELPEHTSTERTDDDNSSHSSDFLGFNDVELISPNVPGMLPTPVVQNLEENVQSAFVSQDLENFMKENALDTSKPDVAVEIPKRRSIEEGLVCRGALPPKLSAPNSSSEISKPRTLAEKRTMMENRRRSMKFWMIDNENTIYREIRKRERESKVNRDVITYIQNSKVPLTRDSWKAGSWLATENGKFYFRVLNVDGTDIKLIGGAGNYTEKTLKPQFSAPPAKQIHVGCPPKCHQNNMLKGIKVNLKQFEDEAQESPEDIKPKPSTPTSKPHICPIKSEVVKPAPLSKKCMFKELEPEYVNLGTLEVFEMPNIELEVFPKVNEPLDEFVKPYLKLICPSSKISREWAEFSVSTLVAANQSESSKDSFKFHIPYLNNQNHLIVRKILNRRLENNFDTEDLQFKKDINLDNKIEVACADMLSEMINSVALGLSEDFIIKKDPDINYKTNLETNALTVEQDQGKPKTSPSVGTKKNTARKLLSELRRLNATVISADSIHPEVPIKCTEMHCELGCVCHSIACPPILRKHCKKIDCMFECKCGPGAQFDFGHLCQDLTDEDALLLREKATARLAKVEKEFCSTVVLTDNKTYLLNESQTERKRPKKAPKRYLDYSDYNPDVVSDDCSKNTYSPPNEMVAKKMKHCNVGLWRLKELNGIEPWCMIHCLYKCFCKCTAIEGYPFSLNCDSQTVTDSNPAYLKRQSYTFEKDKDPSSKHEKVVEKPHHSKQLSRPIVNKSNAEETSEEAIVMPNRVAEHDRIRKQNYLMKAFYICSRATPIPADAYTTANRKFWNQMRRLRISEECRKTAQLLEYRIIRSMVDHRIDKKIAKQDKPKPQESLLKSSHVPAVVAPPLKPAENVQPPHASPPKPPPPQPPGELPIIPIITSVRSLHPTGSKSTPDRDANLEACVNLAVTAEKANSECTGLVDPNLFKVFQSKEFHANAIAKLNSAVTKTMSSICTIQSKNNKYIPSPIPNTLSSHQWQFFLQAYIESLIFVWEIKINGATILAVTKKNIMPLVPNALSVINIKAVRRENLPLIGQMLNAHVINVRTKMLSVLMTGHQEYWRIIGFINSSVNYLRNGCIVKPTPVSHPQLSNKINILFKFLVSREIRTMLDMQRSSKAPSNQDDNKKTASEDTQPSLPPPTLAPINTKFAGIPKSHLPPTNVAIKKITPHELESIYVPIPVVGNHRWLMLTIAEDFSHIYIPSWKSFLSYDKIKKAISLASQSKKTVRLGQGDSGVDVYATPESSNRIYFGPFGFSKKLDIVLYQNVDGRMMLREDFERNQNINREVQSTGCWLYMKNDELLLEEARRRSTSTQSSVEAFEVSTKIDSDDDCFIIDEDQPVPNKIKKRRKTLPARDQQHEKKQNLNRTISTPQKSPTPTNSSAIVLPSTSAANGQNEITLASGSKIVLPKNLPKCLTIIPEPLQAIQEAQKQFQVPPQGQISFVIDKTQYSQPIAPLIPSSIQSGTSTPPSSALSVPTIASVQSISNLPLKVSISTTSTNKFSLNTTNSGKTSMPLASLSASTTSSRWTAINANSGLSQPLGRMGSPREFGQQKSSSPKPPTFKQVKNANTQNQQKSSLANFGVKNDSTSETPSPPSSRNVQNQQSKAKNIQKIYRTPQQHLENLTIPNHLRKTFLIANYNQKYRSSPILITTPVQQNAENNKTQIDGKHNDNPKQNAAAENQNQPRILNGEMGLRDDDGATPILDSNKMSLVCGKSTMWQGTGGTPKPKPKPIGQGSAVKRTVPVLPSRDDGPPPSKFQKISIPVSVADSPRTTTISDSNSSTKSILTQPVSEDFVKRSSPSPAQTQNNNTTANLKNIRIVSKEKFQNITTNQKPNSATPNIQIATIRPEMKAVKVLSGVSPREVRAVPIKLVKSSPNPPAVSTHLGSKILKTYPAQKLVSEQNTETATETKSIKIVSSGGASIKSWTIVKSPSDRGNKNPITEDSKDCKTIKIQTNPGQNLHHLQEKKEEKEIWKLPNKPNLTIECKESTIKNMQKAAGSIAIKLLPSAEQEKNIATTEQIKDQQIKDKQVKNKQTKDQSMKSPIVGEEITEETPAGAVKTLKVCTPGFMISRIAKLGKIPVTKCDNNEYILKIPNFKDSIVLNSFERVQKYLSEYIRFCVKDISPRDFNMNWRFIPANSLQQQHYELHNRTSLNKNVVIRNGVMTGESFFLGAGKSSSSGTLAESPISGNEREQMTQHFKVLGKLCMPTGNGAINRAYTQYDILKKAIDVVEELRAVNLRYLYQKSNLKHKITLNKKILSDLKTLEMLPDTTQNKISHKSKNTKVNATATCETDEVILIDDDDD